MKITLNGVELARRAEGDEIVGEVLSEVRQEIYSAGKIITGIALDGQPLPDGRVRRQKLSASVTAVGALELTVEEPAMLRQRTIRDAASLADKLARQTKPLSRKFRLGDEVTANNELSEFLGDLKLVLAGLDLSTRHSGPAVPAAAIRDRLVESANRLLPSLDRLYKAQAGGDYIAVADELEYDLCEQITAWEPMLADAERTLGVTEQAQ
jgi:hypothetical protein